MLLTRGRLLAIAAVLAAAIAWVLWPGARGGEDPPERAGASGPSAAGEASDARPRPTSPGRSPTSSDPPSAAPGPLFEPVFRRSWIALQASLDAEVARCVGAAPGAVERRQVELELGYDPRELERHGDDAALRVTRVRLLDRRGRPTSREALACLHGLRGRATALVHPAAGDPLADRQPVTHTMTLTLPQGP